MVRWAGTVYGAEELAGVLAATALSFDLSVFDLFAAAHGGAATVLVPPRTSVFPRSVANFIRDKRISVWYSVPTALRRMATADEVADGRLAASALRPESWRQPTRLSWLMAERIRL